jgi:hypothetical protein
MNFPLMIHGRVDSEKRNDKMGWYIKGRDEEGLFIGEFLGLGFFEISIKDGDCSAEERPIKFGSKEEAQEFLDSWVGGPAGCTIVEMEDK